MKSLRQMALVILVVTICLTMTFAQESAQKAEKKSSEQAMPVQKPSPEMQKLTKMLVGTWRTTENYEVSDMMPKGGKGSGTAVITSGPGGLSLIENYRSKGAMGTFSGHGVFWWDDKAQGYKSIWCDDMTPNGCAVANGLGKWDGENLVFEDEQEMMGKKQAMKTTLTSAKPGAVSLTMEGGEPGSPMKKFMTIKYMKSSAGKPASAAKQ